MSDAADLSAPRLVDSVELHRDTGGPEAAAVRAGLLAHRRGMLPDLPEAVVARQPLCFVRRDAQGTIRAGLVGEVTLEWLWVDKFWVDAALRGQGVGGALLAVAEAEAKRQGAIGAHLSTSSFQAPDFYRRQGFTEVGRMADRPTGHERIWFAKRF